jgi:hypothetical protein
MRHVEIVRYRHCEDDSIVAIVKWLSQATRLDAGPPNRFKIFLGCEVNEQCHFKVAEGCRATKRYASAGRREMP